MDKYAREVYNFVLSQPYHSFIYSMYPEQIPGGIDKLQDFEAACRFLADKGYGVVKNPGMIILTHAGVHKRELELIDFRNKLLTHFVPGFFFGVITTVFSGVLIAYILSVLGI